MSGYTGPTGPTGINGIYGPQGEVGPVGGRGNRGVIADAGSSKMQYQSFCISNETIGSYSGGGNQGGNSGGSQGGSSGGSAGGGYIIRPVFQNPNPPIGDSHIPGMQIVSSNALIVPRGTYCVQASSIGVTYGTAVDRRTAVLAIGNLAVPNSCLLAGIQTYEQGVPFVLDGVITLPAITTVELRHYSSDIISLNSSPLTQGWTCLISFMKIQ